MPNEETTKNAPAGAKPYKRKRGDRKEGRWIRSLSPVNQLMAFIMPQRNDALNMFRDAVDVSAAEELLRELKDQGYKNIGMLHVFLAAYVRTVASNPAINRFVSGQRVYARHGIEVVMTVKKEMSLNSPDTVIKINYTPWDTLTEVYEKFNKTLEESKGEDSNTSFDKLTKVLRVIPRPILRGFIRLLNWLDYHGWMPQSLLKLSPFHGSFIITSMGSLAIPPIYHHIYNFGNLPVFLSFGAKRKEIYLDDDGSVKTRPMIDFTVVTDERICDGFNYASALRTMRRYFKNPSALLTPPETVAEDIE
ncbi:MAG: 2-oxo acid dehydrogenase subunit E2 [Clostridia bacterium]|nr:2-oxo acid dehydrogenase subunit E2 [Clostridia bacterium]